MSTSRQVIEDDLKQFEFNLHGVPISYQQQISYLFEIFQINRYTNFRIIPLNLQQTMTSPKSTIDPEEIEFWEKQTSDWWDPEGPFKPLHAMNILRVPLVKNGLINQGVVSKENIYSPTPLKGLSILDVGCGGGFLSEALALLGADVTGIDANSSAIDLAKHHASKNNLSINYLFTSIEEHAIKNVEKYDAITASEVIEHVTKKVQFLEACTKCLKPSGSIFMTTLNKTILTRIFAIYAAENIVYLLPKGTHQIDKCIEPKQLQGLLELNFLQTKEIRGMFYNIFTNGWSWCPLTWINYSLHAVKPKESDTL